MVKFQTVRQKARIILNSEDAVKTTMYQSMQIKEDTLTFDATSGTTVDLANDRIFVANHRFYDNEEVVYTATTAMTSTPTVANNATLFVKVVSNNIFQLSSIAGTTLNITAATGAHTLSRTKAFDGSSAGIVKLATNTLNISSHGFATGDYVQYNVTNGGTAISGLTSGQYYYVYRTGNNSLRLCATYDDATATDPDGNPTPVPVTLTVLGTGSNHEIKRIVSFEVSASPVVDFLNEKLYLPSHNWSTGDQIIYKVDNGGTVVGGLIDNFPYYVVKVDTDSIKLAVSLSHATSIPATVVNLTSVGTGNHTFTRIAKPAKVCTNYEFLLNNIPFDLNDKCRLAVLSFDYIRNYIVPTKKSVGGVYLKELIPSNTYSSQSVTGGTLLLQAGFADNFSYQNQQLEINSMNLPYNVNTILQNKINIFVDSKKRNYDNADINGCLDDDSWSLALVIYELNEIEVKTNELDTNTKNYVNARLV